MTSEQGGFSRSLEERRKELEDLLEEVGYELSEARHRSLADPVLCQAALDRAMRKLADARALVAAEASTR